MLRESMDLNGSNSWYYRTYWCHTVGYCQDATWIGNNKERIHSCKSKDLLEGVHSIITYRWQYGWSWRGGWRWMKMVSNFGVWGSEPLGSIKGKAIPVQAWTGPEGSRRMRLPKFKTPDTWRWYGCQPWAPAAFTQRKYSWYSFLLGTKSTPGPWCDWKDYVNQKFQWHHREANPRPPRLVAQCLNQLRHPVLWVPFFFTMAQQP
jgi:hypothetical protein